MIKSQGPTHSTTKREKNFQLLRLLGLYRKYDYCGGDMLVCSHKQTPSKFPLGVGGLMCKRNRVSIKFIRIKETIVPERLEEIMSLRDLAVSEQGLRGNQD